VGSLFRDHVHASEWRIGLRLSPAQQHRSHGRIAVPLLKAGHDRSAGVLRTAALTRSSDRNRRPGRRRDRRQFRHAGARRPNCQCPLAALTPVESKAPRMRPEPITRSSVALQASRIIPTQRRFVSLRRRGTINCFLMESVAPARYLRITGATQHGKFMRPPLSLENQMAPLWRTFWERSHAA
jgi:hypothetical protein